MLSKIQVILLIGSVLFLPEFNQKLNTFENFNTTIQCQSSWKFFPRFCRGYSYFRQQIIGQI